MVQQNNINLYFINLIFNHCVSQKFIIAYLDLEGNKSMGEIWRTKKRVLTKHETIIAHTIAF